MQFTKHLFQDFLKRHRYCKCSDVKQFLRITRQSLQTTTTAQPVLFTCFILSRSNESVSLPPPPGRALHSGGGEKTDLVSPLLSSCTERNPSALLPPLTSKPLTCLQSSLCPTASLHRLEGGDRGRKEQTPGIDKQAAAPPSQLPPTSQASVSRQE